MKKSSNVSGSLVLVLSMTAVLAVCVAAAGWWSFDTRRASHESARRTEVEGIGFVLAQNATSLFEIDHLVGIQSQVLAAVRQFNLDLCRVVLSDGTVVAAETVAAITNHALPVNRPARSIPVLPDTSNRYRVTRQFSIQVQERGIAQLSIAGPITYPRALLTHSVMSSVAIWAAGVCLMWLVLRWTKGGAGGAGVILDALRAFDGGERSPAALRVGKQFGQDAEAWNLLIDENEQLHEKVVSQRASDSLRRQRQTSSDLDSACDAMWQGLIVVDRQMRSKYVNGAAGVLLQTTRENIVGREISEFIRDKNVLVGIRSAIDGTVLQRRTFEVERKEQDATGMLRISVRPVRREDPASAIVVIEDITQLRVAEDAQHAFVAQVTHELRTPLTNIRLYLENLLRNDEEDPVLRAKSLNVINQESQRLERIVGAMLSVAEMEAGTFQLSRNDVPLPTIFEQIEADYQAQAEEKQIALTFNLPPKLPLMQGDRDKILIALHNVIGNALKYTPSGGRVEVQIDVDDERLKVSVKDTGIGIDEADQERIFDRFYRANDGRLAHITGSGLGLSLAREVMRLHGGDIEVESKRDSGSTFMLTLPVRSDAA